MSKTLPFLCAVLFALLGHTALAAPQSTQATSHPTLPPAWLSLFDKLTFYGDFRARGESDWNRSNGEDRWRARVRLRLGANYSVSEEILVGMRITTGNPNDPRDSNATLGNGAGKMELNLDRIFFTWTPESVDPFFLTLGKFAHPFNRNPVFDELVWYSDIQAEGAVAGSRWRDVGPFESLRTQVGYYVYREDTQGDVSATVAEVMVGSTFSERSRADISAAWYGFTNAGSVPAATVSDYQVLDVIASLRLDRGASTWKFSAEGIANLAVSTPNDTGYALGFSYGQARKQGDWRFYYQYQEIGNDAIFAPLGNADLLLSHNFRGHVGNIDYRLTDKSTIRMRIFQATPIDPSLNGGFSDDTLRAQLDYSVKF